MPRKVRIQYAGAVYHVMGRGDRREAISRYDGEREMFLATLAPDVSAYGDAGA